MVNCVFLRLAGTVKMVHVEILDTAMQFDSVFNYYQAGVLYCFWPVQF